MVTCTEVTESIPALVLDALESSERVEIVAHIDGCSGCREKYQEYAETALGLLLAVQQRVPPPALKGMLMERIQAPRQSWLVRLRAWISAAQVLPRWSLGAACAAALLVVSLAGVQMARLTSQQAIAAEQLQQQQAALALLAGSNIETISMTGTQAANGASAVVRFDAQRTLGVLQVQNLPALSPSQSYQLWLIDADGKRDSGAVFSMAEGSDGKITLVLTAPRTFGNYVRCGVSVEPRGGSLKPTGPAVLTGAYS